MEKIILASSSPRRKELLELIGLPFVIHPSNVEERIKKNALPSEIVEHLALLKANEVATHFNQGIVIGADTIVVLDGKILGKPNDEDEAFSMLKQLQGREHYVYSGVALINVSSKQSLVSHQVTKVFMMKLTEEEILLYIKTREPMDKAGSYGIQGCGALLIEKIEGDYFNVVGLPLSLLNNMLKIFNVNIIKG